mgnify:CR=1 FL=1|jgi:protein PhnA
MSIETALKDRSGSKCELCSRSADLTIYEVPPVEVPGVDSSLLLCQVCLSQIEDPDLVDVHHWRCLNDSMWGTIPAVQASNGLADVDAFGRRRMAAGALRYAVSR